MRIMNWRPNLEMKSTSAVLSLFFVFAFIFNSDANISIGTTFHNSSGNSIVFKKDQSFTNSDSLLSSLSEGKWIEKKSRIILSGVNQDSVLVNDTISFSIINFESPLC